MVQYGEDALTIKKELAMIQKNEEHSDNEQNHDM